MSPEEFRAGLVEALDKLEKLKPRKKVLAVPPDFTRFHSQAGELTEHGVGVLRRPPDGRAAGAGHAQGDERAASLRRCIGRRRKNLFRVHDWRNDIVTLGEVPGEFIREVSEGKVDYPWPAQVNKLLRDGGHDLILSIGQVVPHEVVGMANGSARIFLWARAA